MWHTSFGPLLTMREEEQLQYVRRFVRFRAVIMVKKKSSDDDKAIANLQAVPGVGKSTAQKLVGSGIRTANQLAKASTKKLLGAGLTANMAKKLVVAAAKNTGKKVATKAKAAPKKVATKAKTIAMSAKTVAAKGTAKAKKKLSAKKAPAKKKVVVKKKGSKTVEVSSKTIPTPDWKVRLKKWGKRSD
jgi:nucleotidyltransferase/DNA polymerase involved in DNA repair